MLTINPQDSTPLTLPYTLSESDSIGVRFVYRPPTWTAALAAIEEKTIVIPTIFNGFKYICYSGGLTGSAEPIWSLNTRKTTVDGDATGIEAIDHVIWKGYAYDYLLMPGQDVNSSSWSAVNAIVVASNFTTDYTEAQLGSITPGSTSVELINTITFSTSNYVLKRAIIIPIVTIR